MKLKLVANTPNPEQVIELAGRICYLSEPKGDSGRFIRKRISEGHTSILEHASATFHISDISRACSHQLVRHRLASYSQQSQRYTSIEDFGFVIPDKIDQDSMLKGEYVNLMNHIKSTYGLFTSKGVLPEDARFIFPNACHTQLIMTANFREWRHFLELRLDSHAQWEIRCLAQEICRLLYGIAPNVFEDLIKMTVFSILAEKRETFSIIADDKE